MSDAVFASNSLGAMPTEQRIAVAAGFAPEFALDPSRKCFRVCALLLAADQFAGHLVDRTHAVSAAVIADYRDHMVDRAQQPMMPFDVFRGTRQHELDPGAQLARVAHQGAGLHAVALGFHAGREAAGGFRLHRNHADRFAAQARVLLLLHRGEVAVEIDEKAAQGHGGVASRGPDCLGYRRRMLRDG